MATTTTSDNMYTQYGEVGVEGKPQLKFLPPGAARDVYEELFSPDDLPKEPKRLLAEILQSYADMAQGVEQPPDGGIHVRHGVYVMGFPFLPSAGNFITWLREGLAQAREQPNLKIDIIIVLYSEAWPTSWDAALKFWDSKMVSDPVIAPYLKKVDYLSPPVQIFLKAGFGGINIL